MVKENKLISIILPNLNTPLNFLKERIDSIINQSYENWDCIIIDGFSDNGSAEYLQSITESDGRFKFYQRPRKGIYDAWNEGIKLAENEFVYVATSDDTMASDFFCNMLESILAAPNCEIACSYLNLIDEKSTIIDGIKWEKFSSGTYFGDILNKEHIRNAPHDGILHAITGMVYTSITQLLIKKTVFEKIGYFLIDKGAIADFEWEMRASLLCNVIYISKTFATWRKYSGQATQDNYNNAAYYKSVLSLVEIAYNSAIKINQDLTKRIALKECLFSFSVEKYRFSIKEAKGVVGKMGIFLQCIFFNPSVALQFILEILRFRSRYDNINYAKKNLKYVGIEMI